METTIAYQARRHRRAFCIHGVQTEVFAKACEKEYGVRTPPRNISVFTYGSKEFSSFYESVISDDSKSDGGILIKYEPCSKFVKIGGSLILLFMSFGLIFITDNPQQRMGATIVGLLFLLLLGVWINSRFEETWFVLTRKQLVIKRWRYIVPGHKIATYNRRDILSVDYQQTPKVSKTSRSYTMWFVLRDSSSRVAIMYDISAERIAWLTGVISSWRKTGHTK